MIWNYGQNSKVFPHEFLQKLLTSHLKYGNIYLSLQSGQNQIILHFYKIWRAVSECHILSQLMSDTSHSFGQLDLFFLPFRKAGEADRKKMVLFQHLLNNRIDHHDAGSDSKMGWLKCLGILVLHHWMPSTKAAAQFLLCWKLKSIDHYFLSWLGRGQNQKKKTDKNMKDSLGIEPLPQSSVHCKPGC